WIFRFRAAVFRDALRWRHAGRRQEQIAFADADLHQFVEDLAAEDLIDALLHGFYGRHGEQFVWPGGQRETLVGMRQGVVRDQRRDVSEFGLFGAQKLAPRRHVVEQVAYRDHGAAAERRFLTAQHFAAGDFDACPRGFIHRPRLQQEARYRRD